MHISIDIETIPYQGADAEQLARSMVKPGNRTKPESIQAHQDETWPEALHATGLNGAYGEVFCVCLAVEDDPVQTFSRGQYWVESDSERMVLNDVNKALASAAGNSWRWVQFIGHNIEFDLRFLFHRMVIHRIQPKVNLPYNDAVWKGTYYDTQYAWAGARGHIRLKALSDALGILPGATDIDGSEVWGMIQAGELSVVEEHCALDVERVRQIWKRLTFRE